MIVCLANFIEVQGFRETTSNVREKEQHHPGWMHSSCCWAAKKLRWLEVPGILV